MPARKWASHVRSEITVRVALIVYVDCDATYQDVVSTLTSFYTQTVKPFEVIVIYNNNGEDAPASLPVLISRHDQTIRWRIESIKKEADFGEALDYVINSKQTKSIYFAVCRAGYEFPYDYLETIDKAINEELIRFVALEPDHDNNGLFVQIPLYKFLQGNRKAGGCIDVLEKIKSVAQEENTSFMVKSFEELRLCV